MAGKYSIPRPVDVIVGERRGYRIVARTYPPDDVESGVIAMDANGVSVGDMGFGLVSLKSIRKCAEDLHLIARSAGVRTDAALVITAVHVDDEVRGRGIGVDLYVAAAIVARKRGLAIVAHACLESGATSHLARRVWRSASLHKRLIVSGLVGAYPDR